VDIRQSLSSPIPSHWRAATAAEHSAEYPRLCAGESDSKNKQANEEQRSKHADSTDAVQRDRWQHCSTKNLKETNEKQFDSNNQFDSNQLIKQSI
jgi:hypothetical protein